MLTTAFLINKLFTNTFTLTDRQSLTKLETGLQAEL